MAYTNLIEIYDILFDAFGSQDWWPAKSRFEVVVGAVLTQNTNWSNVQKAIENLEREGLLSFEKMVSISVEELAYHIRPSGYYNIKAKRLRNLLDMVRDNYEGEFDLLFDEDMESAREALLSVKGVGPETADSIMLYGGKYPVFVVDAYTHRILVRHSLIDEEADYYAIQQEFLDQLPHETDLFNEYHALLVQTGKQYCKKKNPLCNRCPLNRLFEEQ